MLRDILVPGSLLAFALSTNAQTDPADISWIDRNQLADGEVVVQTGKADRLTVTIDAAVRIDALPQSIWTVLTSCDIAPEYVSNVKSCELVETINNGQSQFFVQTVKPAFFLPSFEHVFRLDYEPYTRINVSRVSGPIAHMEGSWRLLRQDDGAILLVHSLQLNPGVPVPRFVVRATLKRDLPKILNAVRERAESVH